MEEDNDNNKNEATKKMREKKHEAKKNEIRVSNEECQYTRRDSKFIQLHYRLVCMIGLCLCLLSRTEISKIIYIYEISE